MPLGTQYRVNLICRYKDMYRDSDKLLRSSKFFNRFGIVATCLAILGTVAVAFDEQLIAFLIGIFSSLAIFGSFRFASLLIRSQAQIFAVCVDGVLNDSPFLTDDERAEVMGLEADTRRLHHGQFRRALSRLWLSKKSAGRPMVAHL